MFEHLPPEEPAVFSHWEELHRKEQKDLAYARRWGLPDSIVVSPSIKRSAMILGAEGFHVVKTHPRERLQFSTLTFRG